jgi:hypothetical protein
MSDRTNEAGQLGWGESGALSAYLLMYRAHGDAKYLDKIIDHFDRVLANRDDARGVKDYRGLSLPAWQSAGHYTCGAVTLNDARGTPVLSVRTAWRPAAKVTVQVLAGASPDTFTLRCARGSSAGEVVDAYDNLSMALSDTRFAPRHLCERFGEINRDGTRLMITAADLRPPGDASAGILAPTGPTPMRPQPYVYAVQTGMILQPIAQFVRRVSESKSLSRNPRYRDKAARYLEAVERALEVFDDEWREDEKTGEGWLVWRRGAPVAFDGADQPHNQYLALGSVMLHVSACASTPELRRKYSDRATKMARTFKNDLKPAENGGFSWTYFWTKGRPYNGWTAADDVSDYQPDFVHGGRRDGYKSVEDTSHAHIDVTFARWAFDAGLRVFDENDMRAFTATYAKNILRGARASERVDGGGKQGTYDNIAAAGVQFARWDVSILDKVKRLYTAGPGSGAPQSRLLGTAWLNLVTHARASEQ